jgi:hypothetical protein
MPPAMVSRMLHYNFAMYKSSDYTLTIISLDSVPATGERVARIGPLAFRFPTTLADLLAHPSSYI